MRPLQRDERSAAVGGVAASCTFLRTRLCLGPFLRADLDVTAILVVSERATFSGLCACAVYPRAVAFQRDTDAVVGPQPLASASLVPDEADLDLCRTRRSPIIKFVYSNNIFLSGATGASAILKVEAEDGWLDRLGAAVAVVVRRGRKVVLGNLPASQHGAHDEAFRSIGREFCKILYGDCCHVLPLASQGRAVRHGDGSLDVGRLSLFEMRK
jgi:hypothetical protein